MQYKETNYIFAFQFRNRVKDLIHKKASCIKCGVEQLVARRAHNPKVARSSRVPATNSVGGSQLAVYCELKTGNLNTEMARSSRGEDARFSFWKQGFDSPTGYRNQYQMM